MTAETGGTYMSRVQEALQVLHAFMPPAEVNPLEPSGTPGDTLLASPSASPFCAFWTGFVSPSTSLLGPPGFLRLVFISRHNRTLLADWPTKMATANVCGLPSTYAERTSWLVHRWP